MGAAVPIPENDPFYQPPWGFESSPPGTIFKHRTSPSGMANVVAMQILYRTTDVTTNPIATVTTILKGPLSTGDKLASYTGFDSAANSTCAPSYLFYTDHPSNLFGPTMGPDVSLGLANGWTIVIPDYDGPTSAVAAGRLEAHTILDGLRATLSYKPAGINKNATLGGYGYSGGAIAAGQHETLIRKRPF